MKKIFLLTIAFICLLLASCSSSGDYKECSYIKADNVELYAGKSTRELVRFVCESAEIKELYTTSVAIKHSSSEFSQRIFYNDQEYVYDGEVGEFYVTKTVIKYDQKAKKALEITEKNANISLPKSIYEALKAKEIYLLEDTFIYYYQYNRNDFTGAATKLEYAKYESNYDLSGSSSIQYVYA